MKKLISFVLVFVLISVGCNSFIEPNNVEIETIEKGYSEIDLENVESETEEYQDKERNYIIVTNASRTEQLQKLRVGDKFIGLILEEIYFSRISNINYEEVEARFSGEIIITGDFKLIRGEQNAFDVDLFSLHEDSLDKLPWLDSNHGNIVVAISNFEKLLELLEVTEETIINTELGQYEIKNVTIKIDNFTIFQYPTEGWNYARIVDVLSIGLGQYLQ